LQISVSTVFRADLDKSVYEVIRLQYQGRWMGKGKQLECKEYTRVHTKMISPMIDTPFRKIKPAPLLDWR